MPASSAAKLADMSPAAHLYVPTLSSATEPGTHVVSNVTDLKVMDLSITHRSNPHNVQRCDTRPQALLKCTL